MKCGITIDNEVRRHKFLTFAERISLVSIDIFRSASKLTTHELQLVENETHFSRELESCRTRLSNQFVDTYSKLKPLTISLPMIIFQLHNIVDILLSGLETEDLSLSSGILSLIGILSRDMRSDFYVHFPKVLVYLVEKMDTWQLHPDLLESLFQNLSYLFKYLEVYLLKDFSKIFSLYCNFLRNRKDHVRKFAAESFAYLIRKTPSKRLKQHLKIIFSAVESLSHPTDNKQQKCNQYLVEGIGELLFYTVKGVDHQFTRCMSTMFKNIFTVYHDAFTCSFSQPLDITPNASTYVKSYTSLLDSQLVILSNYFLVLNVLMLHCKKHLLPHDSLEIWDVFQAILCDALDLDYNINPKYRTLFIGHLSQIIMNWSAHRNSNNKVIQGFQEITIPQSLKFASTLTQSWLFKEIDSHSLHFTDTTTLQDLASYKEMKLCKDTFKKILLLIKLVFNYYRIKPNDSIPNISAVECPKELSTIALQISPLLRKCYDLFYFFNLVMADQQFFSFLFLTSILEHIEINTKLDLPKPNLNLIQGLNPKGTMNVIENMKHSLVGKNKQSLKSELNSLLSHQQQALFLFLYELGKNMDYSSLRPSQHFHPHLNMIIPLSQQLFLLIIEKLHQFEKILEIKIKESDAVDPCNQDYWIPNTMTSQIISQLYIVLAALSQFVLHVSQVESMWLALQNIVILLEDSRCARFIPFDDHAYILAELMMHMVNICKVLTTDDTHYDFNPEQLGFLFDHMLTNLQRFYTSFHILNVAHQCFLICATIATKRDDPEMATFWSDSLLPKLKSTSLLINYDYPHPLYIALQHPFTSARTMALNSLKMIQDTLGISIVDAKLLDQCIQFNQIEITPLNYKVMIAQIDYIYCISVNPTSSSQVRLFTINFLLGLLYVKIMPISKAVSKTLSLLLKLEFNQCAGIFFDFLSHFFHHENHMLSPISSIEKLKLDIQYLKENHAEYTQHTHDHYRTFQNFNDLNHLTLQYKESIQMETEIFNDPSTVASFAFSNLIDIGGEILSNNGKWMRILVDWFMEYLIEYYPNLNTKKIDNGIFDQSITSLMLVEEFWLSKEDNQGQMELDDGESVEDKELVDTSLAITDQLTLPYEPCDDPSCRLLPHLSRRKTLAGYLTLFSECRNTNDLFGDKHTLMSFLEKLFVQTQAPSLKLLLLKCLMIWPKYDIVQPHYSKLSRLINENYDSPTTKFHISLKPNHLIDPDRSVIVPIVINILLPTLLNMSKKNETARRSILGYFFNLASHETEILLNVVLRSYLSCISSCKESMLLQSPYCLIPDHLAQISIPQANHENILTLLFEFVENMSNIFPFLDKIIILALALIYQAQQKKITNVTSYSQRKIRSFGTKLLAKLVHRFSNWDYQPYETSILAILKFEGEVLANSSEISQTPSFLLFLHKIVLKPAYIHLLTPFIGLVVKCLKVPKISQSADDILITIISSLLDQDSHAINPDIYSAIQSCATNPLATTLTEKNQNAHSIIHFVNNSDQNKSDASVISCIINIGGNPVHQSSSLPSNECCLSTPLQPYADDIIDTLYQRFLMRSTKKYIITQMEWRIIENCINYVTSGQHADKLISFLMLFMKQQLTNSSLLERSLKTVQRLIIHSFDPKLYLDQIADLFAIVENHHLQILCSIVEQYSQVDIDFKPLVSLLYELTASPETLHSEFDCEKQLVGYKQIIDNGIYKQFKFIQFKILVQILIRHLVGKDISLHSNALDSLSLIIKHISNMANDFSDKLCIDLVTDIIFPTIKTFLSTNISLNPNGYKHMLALLSALVEVLPKYYSYLSPALGETADTNWFLNICHIKYDRRVNALAHLTNKINDHLFGEEVLVDIFLPVTINLFLETIKCPASFYNALKDTTLAITSSLSWKYYKILIDQLFKLAEGHPNHNQTIDLLCSVLDTFHFEIDQNFTGAIQSLGRRKKIFQVRSINQALPDSNIQNNDTKDDDESENKLEDLGFDPVEDSDEYEDVQDKPSLKEQPTSPKRVDDQLHQDENFSSDSDEKKQQHLLEQVADDLGAFMPQVLAPEKVHNSTMSHEDHLISASPEYQIQRDIVLYVFNNILPKLQSIMSTKINKTVIISNTSVASASLKLLKGFPISMTNNFINQLIIRLSQQCGSKINVHRAKAILTLKEILNGLGFHYFPLIAKVLQSNLKRGYQLHVLGFSIHLLLESMVDKVKPGEIDECIDSLNKFFYEELLGQLADQKKVSKVVLKTEEASKNYALSSMLLLSRIIHFNSSHRKLIEPAIEALLLATDITLIRKMRLVLNTLHDGFCDNSSATVEQLLTLCYHLIARFGRFAGLEITKSESKDSATSKILQPHSCIIEPNPFKDVQVFNSLSVKSIDNTHFLVEFALKLLRTALTGGLLQVDNPDHLSLLDPFVKILIQSIKSRHDEVVSESIECLTSCLKFNLPSLNNKSYVIAEVCIHLLRTSNQQSKLFMLCFKSLRKILNHYQEVTLSSGLVQIVLGYIAERISSHKPLVSLQLLYAIVSKCYLEPVIYDIMKKIAELLLKSSEKPVQSQCKIIFLQFLLRYPLKTKRLEQYIELIMSNLNFEQQHGRIGMLLLLKDLFLQFPSALLHSHSNYFFMPLVVQLINEEDAECRGLITEILDTFIKRVDHEHATQLLALAISWYDDDQAKISLQSGAARLFPIFALHLGERYFKPHWKRLRSIFEKRIVLCQRISPFYERNLDRPSYLSDDDERWKMIYFSLVALEQIFSVLSKATLDIKVSSLWNLIASSEVLLFPHPWVRMVSARLMGVYFSLRKVHQPVVMLENNKSSPQANLDWLIAPGRLLQLNLDFINQLDGANLSTELGTQVIKNLYYVTQLLAKDASLRSQNPIPKEYVKDDNPKLQEKNDSSNSLSLLSSIDRDVIQLIYEKMSLLATKPLTILKKSVFQWFAAMITVLEPIQLVQYAPLMIGPLSQESHRLERILDQSKRRDGLNVKEITIDPDLSSMHELITAVNDMLIQKIGSNDYFSIYNKIRGLFVQKISQLKLKKVVEATRNPTVLVRNKIKPMTCKMTVPPQTRKRTNTSFASDSKSLRKRSKIALNNY